jgi:hypothetical protein
VDEWEDEQLHEMKLQQAVEKAVSTADRIILDASDGSVEETNYLTGLVAQKFFEKACIIPNSHALLKRKMYSRIKKGE